MVESVLFTNDQENTEDYMRKRISGRGLRNLPDQIFRTSCQLPQGGGRTIFPGRVKSEQKEQQNHRRTAFSTSLLSSPLCSPAPSAGSLSEHTQIHFFLNEVT